MTASQAHPDVTSIEFRAATVNKRETGYLWTGICIRVHQRFEAQQKTRGVVGEVYERADSKSYSCTSSQGNDVRLRCHSATLWRCIAFGVRQQEYFGCWRATADARHSCQSAASGRVVDQRVGWNHGRLRQRADSAPGEWIPDQAELQG